MMFAEYLDAPREDSSSSISMPRTPKYPRSSKLHGSPHFVHLLVKFPSLARQLLQLPGLLRHLCHDIRIRHLRKGTIEVLLQVLKSFLESSLVRFQARQSSVELAQNVIQSLSQRLCIGI